MIPVDEAIAAVLGRIAPLPARTAPITEAAGLVLAETIRADGPMPPFAASARDGYAVVAADGPGLRTLVGEVSAGAAPEIVVRPGEVARIATGAPLPVGADAVVMVEQTAERDGRIEIGVAVAAGADIRPAGQDYSAQAVLLEALDLLDAAAIGLLAAVGRTTVSAYPRPRVAVLSSGDELVAPTEVPGPGQIRDSNRFALLAAVEAAGGMPVDAGHLADSEDDVARLGVVAHAADVVVTTGGVSMGHRDLVKPWLAAHGDLVFGRVRIKPGKPVTFGMLEGRPFFALPGFPVSALVCFELFVRPALLRLAGHVDVRRPTWQVRLAHDVEHDPNRVEFARAIVTLSPSGPEARITGAQGSGRLLSWAGANALLRLPDGRTHSPAGTMLPALIVAPVGAS